MIVWNNWDETRLSDMTKTEHQTYRSEERNTPDITQSQVSDE